MPELKSALETADRTAASLMAQRNATSAVPVRDYLDMLRVGFLFFIRLIHWRIEIEVTRGNLAYLNEAAIEINRIVVAIEQSIAIRTALA